MSTIDLNAFLELKDEALQERIQAIYKGLPHKTIIEPLDEAIKSGLLKTLKEQGIEPDTKDNKLGATLLHYTASAGHSELLKILIAIGFNPHATYEGNRGLMHDAVWSGNIEMATNLAKENFKLDITDNDGDGLLYYVNNHVAMLNYLIQNGVKLNTEDSKLLFNAAQRGHIQTVKAFIEMGLKVDLNLIAKSPKKQIPTLYNALLLLINNDISNATEIVALLKKMGIEPGTKSKNGAEFSHYAAQAGHTPLLKILISVGFNLKATYLESTIGLLHNAIWSGNVDTVDTLIEMGLDLNILDKNGFGLLHYAVLYNKIEMLHHLISKGLKLDKYDSRFLSLATCKKQLKMLQLLFEMGFKIDLSNLYKELLTNFYEIFFKHLDVKTPAGKAEALNILAKAGINIGTKSEIGLTFLHYATVYGHVELFNALVIIGFDKNTTDHNGHNTFIRAAKNGHTDMVKTLIQAGIKIELNQLYDCTENTLKKVLSTIHKLFFCIDFNNPTQKDEASNAFHKAVTDINTKDKYGRSLLHYVALAGEVDLFKALIAIGFDKNVIDNRGFNALIDAAFSGQVEMVKTLVAMGLKINLNQFAKLKSPNKHIETLYEALLKPIDINTAAGKAEALNILANVGIGAEAKNNHGTGFLHIVSTTNLIEILKYLINIGFDKNLVNKSGYGLLHFAVSYDQIKMAKYLISIGLNKNATDRLGQGLLHSAATYCESIETIKWLVSIGLDKNARSELGEVPLHVAVKHGDIKKITALLDMGFRENSKFPYYSSLWHAANSGHRLLLELLIKKYGFDLPNWKSGYIPGDYSLTHSKTDINKEAIELYLDKEQLRLLHFSYLSPFALQPEIEKVLNPIIPVKGIIDTISAYLPSGNEEEYEALRDNVVPALKLRKKLLKPLAIFCDQNPVNKKARTTLNELLASKKLGAVAFEKELDDLLNDFLNPKTSQAVAAADFVPKLVECRRKTQEITGNKLTFAQDNLAVLQGNLDYEKQKTNNEALTLKNQLQNFAAFQFKCLCFFATIDAATLALSLLAICALNPVAVGIAVASLSAINLAGIFYNFYQHKKNSDTIIKKQTKPNLSPEKDPIEIAENKPELTNNSQLSLQSALKNQQQELIAMQQKNIAFKNQLQASYVFQFKFLYACTSISSATAILGILTIAAFNPVIAAITLTLSVASLLGTSYGFYSNYKDTLALDPNKKIEPASSKKSN